MAWKICAAAHGSLHEITNNFSYQWLSPFSLRRQYLSVLVRKRKDFNPNFPHQKNPPFLNEMVKR